MPEHLPESVRTFVAIPLPPAVKHFLADIQAELKSGRVSASWPDPQNFHLTVKFLGPTPRELLPSIQSVMTEFSGTCPDIRLRAEGVGVFPSQGPPRVVWSGIQGRTQPLKQLVRDLDTALQSLGIPENSRPFSPHITLARMKKPISYRRLAPLIQPLKMTASKTFSVTHLVFYQSRLAPEGARHTPLFQIRVSRFK
jgi:2'-5' RNA ligase